MFRNSLLLFGVAIYLLALSPIATEAQTTITGYPTLDVPPPPVANWTSLVNLAMLPQAPVRTLGQACDPVDKFCYWPCTNCLNSTTDVATCPGLNDWGITYDDGPSASTPMILDYLKAKGLKATFFVIGSRITENPDILLRTAKEGHQIGIHTWSHTALTTQTNEVIIAELKWTEKLIKQVTGFTPKYMRPPGGDFDDRVRGIATQLGYKSVIWDRDTFDWKSQQDKTFDLNWIQANFTEWVAQTPKTGHVSLEHDLYPQTAAKAPGAIDIVMKAGYNIKPISVCTNTIPYLEGNLSDTTTTSSSPANAATTLQTAASTNKTSAATTINYNIFIIAFGAITINIFISFL